MDRSLGVRSDIHCECSKSIAYVTRTKDIEYSVNNGMQPRYPRKFKTENRENSEL